MDFDVSSTLLHGLFHKVKLAPPRPAAGGQFCGGLAAPETFPDFARHNQEQRVVDTAVPDFTAEPATLEGNYIYGGVLMNHFGHLMTECLHRLWLTDTEEYAGWPVVFVAHSEDFSLQSVFEAAMQYFGIANYRVVHEDTVVNRLAIGQAGKQFRTASHPQYLRWLEVRVPNAGLIADGLPPKLCVMRGHLWSGRLIGEGLIEEWLSEEGYHVFRPEDHSLAQQIAYFASAEHIVFSEGSALHTLDIMAPIKAKVAVLQRRPLSVMAKTSVAPKVAELTILKNAVRLLHPGAAVPNPLSNALSFMDLGDVADFLTMHGVLTENPAAQRYSTRAYSADLRAFSETKIHPGSMQALSPPQALERALEDMFHAHREQFRMLSDARYKLFLSKAYHALELGAYDRACEFARCALEQVPGAPACLAVKAEAALGIRRCETAIGCVWDKLLRAWRLIRKPAGLPKTEPPRKDT